MGVSIPQTALTFSIRQSTAQVHSLRQLEVKNYYLPCLALKLIFKVTFNLWQMVLVLHLQFLWKTNVFYVEEKDQVASGAVEDTDGFPVCASGFQMTDVSGVGHRVNQRTVSRHHGKGEWVLITAIIPLGKQLNIIAYLDYNSSR